MTEQIENLTTRIAELEKVLGEKTAQLEQQLEEHKKIESIIARAKKEWEATFDAVMDMIILTDHRGRVLRTNQSTSYYMRRPYAEMIGTPIWELFYGDQTPDHQVFLSVAKEVQFPTLSGWFDVGNYPLLLQGSAYGNVYVITDITERRKAQEELRKINDELEIRVHQRTLELSHANQELQYEVKEREKVQDTLANERDLLATTLLSIRDGVISTDQNGLITLFNKAAEQITGLFRSEVIGKPINEIIKIFDEKHNQLTPDPLSALLGGMEKQDAVSPLIMLNKNGSRLLISSSGAPIWNQNGELIGYVMVLNNITEQKRIEEQLALSQKLESIGQLAAGIAHEINTPMQYVGDNTHFLNDAFNAIHNIFNAHAQAMENSKTPGDVLATTQKLKDLQQEADIEFYMSEIPTAIQQSLDGIDRVRKIVLAMKSFSHPTNKEKQLADINQGIETTLIISRNEWKYVADLETDFDAQLPQVYCNIDELNQVILNMIVNASHTIQERLSSTQSNDKGKITIRTRSEGNNVLISIQDTGNGIAKENLNRIFDPFFTTKDVGKGTGQGLSLAHNIIVNEHKGKILVDSEVGKGTTFTIWLPITEQEENLPDEGEEA